MLYGYAAKILKVQKRILKCVIDARYGRYHFGLLIFATVMVIHLWASLPLNKPIFFAHNTSIDHRRDVSGYIYKYIDAYRNLKLNYKILLWTPFFGSEDWNLKDFSMVFAGCPVSSCVLTHNKSEVRSSDVLLFHTRDLYDPSEFMKYIYHTNYYALPKYRTSEQLWVLLNNESPVNENVDYSKFNGVFNWTGTYKKASEIHTPYGVVDTRSKTDVPTDAAVDGERTSVVWIASNCKDQTRRQLLVHKLQKYIHVDQYGSCGKAKLTSTSYEQVLRKYKFYLSFENSICEDYITEKFFQSLRFRTLPVVYGGGNYKENAPPNSYIDIRDFNNAQEVADYLSYLERNNTAYNEYFEWTKEYKITMNYHWCRICEAVNVKRIPHQVYTDLDGWFKADICKQLSSLEQWSKNIDGWAALLGII